MNTSELKISDVVPVYNCEKYIERAIESVIKQTYDNWELIIVNDGSKDSSLQIAQKFAGKDADTSDGKDYDWLMRRKHPGICSCFWIQMTGLKKRRLRQ